MQYQKEGLSLPVHIPEFEELQKYIEQILDYEGKCNALMKLFEEKNKDEELQKEDLLKLLNLRNETQKLGV